jgi:hypothetical protein
MSDRQKAHATIERELQRVRRDKALALFLHQRENEDWLFGAEQALLWVLGKDAMAPAKAFSVKETA